MGKEIGTLTDGGFQKFFTTPGGKRKPALAEELKEIHNFQEDLREALGLTTLYNESLGTVSNLYLYDRVEGRDQRRARQTLGSSDVTYFAAGASGGFRSAAAASCALRRNTAARKPVTPAEFRPALHRHPFRHAPRSCSNKRCAISGFPTPLQPTSRPIPSPRAGR